ncbi:hypothetical protein ABWK22_02805 [Gottfriedia acidiceleris]|uniref:hypothetical protein n=1 Tax=Gottfriedia acidiceleris TaxID=371036 RepID=UPI00339A5821
MSALYPRHTKFESKLSESKDIFLSIGGIPTTITYTYHSIKQSIHRSVIESVVVMMIQNAFDELLDLHSGERFIISDTELCVSVVGALWGDGGDIAIDLATVIDSANPTNPHGTFRIAI